MLFPEQIENVEHMIKTFDESHIVQNASPTGSGKTYITSAIAAHYGFDMIVIGPKSAEFTWTRVAKEFGVHVTFYTFAAIRGVIDRKKRAVIRFGPIQKTLAHGYLIRTDNRSEFSSETTFKPTAYYLDMIKKGVLLVVDECHHIKNTSDQSHAVKALIQPLSKAGTLMPQTPSRALFLSATPFDKEDHSVNMCRAMGVIHHRNLATCDEFGVVQLQGLEELSKVCQTIHPDRTTQIVNSYDLNLRTYAKCAYQLYVDVLKTKIVTSLPPPVYDQPFDIKNGFFKMTENDREKLLEGINNLAKAVRYSKTRNEIGDFRNISWDKVNSAMLEIERAKLHIFVRATSEYLEQVCGSKVVIFVQYRSSVEFLRNVLQPYGVEVFVGSMSTDERARAVNAFQNPDQKVRIMVCTVAAGKESISLHDTTGKEPRLTLTIANYSPTDIHQISGRTNRQGRKTPAMLRVVYGKDTLENKILNALARKSTVIKSTLDKTTGILLPGEYESWIEEDDFPHFESFFVR